MGTRPAFHILVGFEKKDRKRDPEIARKLAEIEYEDPDHEIEYYHDDDHVGDKHCHDINVPGYSFTMLREIIYNMDGDNDHEHSDVVGLELLERNREYDDDVLRFLAVYNDTYMIDGHIILPSHPMSDWEKHARGITEEDITCHRMVSGVFESQVTLSRLEWKRAVFYLAQAGWIITERDLYYILVWDWS